MKTYLLLTALVCMFTAQASGQTHGFITGPIKNGPEATKLCLECHEKLAHSMMKTVHWNWAKKQPVNGKDAEYGKKNALSSNACFALPSNWQGCTNCHAGYGWVDETFEFGKAENVDCLACHETTGTYKKVAGGHPAEQVDLVDVARSVAMPSRAACGSCHFYGGGGDGFKHGDLDSSLADPAPEIDIHMGGKAKLTCESCHKAGGHDVRGEAISVSPGSGPRAMGCTDCHKRNVHKSAALNKHVRRVACQTCHIPIFAKGEPTVMSWDWSTAGKNDEIKKDGNAGKVYDKMMGDLTLGKDLVPTYLWYNGSVERVLLGDKINHKETVELSAPKGERKDPEAKIFPFKVMKGKQPYDTVNRTVAVVNFHGPSASDTAYWVKFDWNKAIEAGMKAAAQPYSGKYGWVETTMVWSLNHMVAPKEKALRCPECHGQNGRINWKELGYPKDPRLGKN